MAMLATRHGQLLNKTDLAAPLGISVPTITHWFNVLETTAQIFVVPPWFENLGKRLVKSPKIYIADSGMACHLLGIRTAAELARSPFLGQIFEGFVASEIIKSQIHRGGRRELYHFRDEQGLEVDFVYPDNKGRVALVECKASRTARPDMARSMQALGRTFESRSGTQRKITMTLVHQPSKSSPTTTAVADRVAAVSVQQFSASLNE
jgi:hypothetical protein